MEWESVETVKGVVLFLANNKETIPPNPQTNTYIQYTTHSVCIYIIYVCFNIHVQYINTNERLTG